MIESGNVLSLVRIKQITYVICRVFYKVLWLPYCLKFVLIESVSNSEKWRCVLLKIGIEIVTKNGLVKISFFLEPIQ